MLLVSQIYVWYTQWKPPRQKDGQPPFVPINLREIPKEFITHLRIRSWTGVFANLIVGVGIMVVPLVVTNVVCNLSPFFTVLLAFCFLKEDFLWIEIFAMFVSFGGIGMIAYGTPSEGNE